MNVFNYVCKYQKRKNATQYPWIRILTLLFMCYRKSTPNLLPINKIWKLANMFTFSCPADMYTCWNVIRLFYILCVVRLVSNLTWINEFEFIILLLVLIAVNKVIFVVYGFNQIVIRCDLSHLFPSELAATYYFLYNTDSVYS